MSAKRIPIEWLNQSNATCIVLCRSLEILDFRALLSVEHAQRENNSRLQKPRSFLVSTTYRDLWPDELAESDQLVSLPRFQLRSAELPSLEPHDPDTSQAIMILVRYRGCEQLVRYCSFHNSIPT